jgi:uncharacterized protein (TIGR02145 family)
MKLHFSKHRSIVGRMLLLWCIVFSGFIASSQPQWVPTQNLQFNMQVTSRLMYNNGTLSSNPSDIIAAFVGQECRGVASPDASYSGVVFLTVGSNLADGEEVTYKAWLADVGIVVELKESHQFISQAEIGTMASPFVFTYDIATDMDGNIYSIVQVGGNKVMGQNLRATHYRNGNPIPTGLSAVEWQSTTQGAYVANGAKSGEYGNLYNFYAVTNDLCPEGWHVPSDQEWKDFEQQLGMGTDELDNFSWRGTDQGGQMKSTGTIEASTGLWYDPNTGATNSSGIGITPDGFYDGVHNQLGYNGYVWSSTSNDESTAFYRLFGYDSQQVAREITTKNYGFSVRCFMDQANVNLVAYYPFNSLTTDASGNGNEPTYSGVSYINDRFGSVDAAASFNGVDSYIQIPHSTSLDFTGEITVSAWINPSRVDIEQQTISSKGGGWNRAGWLLTLNNDKVRWHLGDGSSEGMFDTEKSIQPNRWTHILATWKDGVMSIYIDGVLDNYSATWASGLVSNTYDHYIGKNDNIDFYFNGTIDEVSIYNISLTPTQISELYANYHAPMSLSAVPADGQITLNWSSVRISEIDRYEVYQDGTHIYNVSNTTMHTITGLTNYQRYTFYIQSVDIYGNVSQPSVTVHKAPSATTVTDIDGNVYPTVTIGTQEWMAENLMVTHYGNGDPISAELDNAQWAATTQGALAIYPYADIDGLSSIADVLQAYGALYNGFAVSDSRGLCPVGWRVPAWSEDWNVLENFVSPESGGKLKSTRTSPLPHPRWDDPNSGATNEVGFSALPSGSRFEDGVYNYIGQIAFWWTSTVDGNLWYKNINYNQTDFSQGTNWGNNVGFSVRCIKDPITTDLVAHYPLNGDANDASAFANHGSAASFIPTANRFAEAGSALYVDGTNPVAIPSSNALAFGANDFTIGFWFTLADVDRVHNGLFGRNDFEGIALEYNHDSDRQLYIFVNAEGSTGWDLQWKPAYNNWVSNTWYYLTLKREGTSLTLYINGSPVENTSIAFNISNPATNLFLGRSQLGDRTHLGNLDDFRVYNRALSDSEISNAYHENGWDTSSPDLLAFYPFNGNANDESGNNLNGTVINATLTADRFSTPDNAYYFNSSLPSEILISESIDLLGGRTEASFAAWVYPMATGIHMPVMNLSSQFSFGVNANNAVFLDLTLSDGSTYTYTSTQTVTPNEWSFLTAVYNGTEVFLFINGGLAESYAVTGSLYSNGGGIFRLGLNDNSNGFEGNLDDLRVYNYAISHQEIQGIFHEGGYGYPFAGGSGTQADPWLIETADQLSYLQNLLGPEHADKYYQQTLDIDLGISPWNEGEGWLPIGTATMPFYGHYDGNSHSIHNLTINRPTQDGIGLFGTAVDASFDNLGVINVSINGNWRVGPLVGNLINQSSNPSVSNVHTTGHISGYVFLGGLAGIVRYGTISSCDSEVDVTQLDGENYQQAAGLIGRILGTSVANSFSSGTITGASNGHWNGGLIGIASGGSTIENCYATGDVSGSNYLGGLVAAMQNNSNITNSYSVGRIADAGNAGGLVGAIYEDGGQVNNSYWNTETSGFQHSAGGEGRTTNEMIYQATYNSWDFTSTWAITQGVTYPYLQRQGTPGEFNFPETYLPPSNLTAVSGNGSIFLSWNAPSMATPSGYMVYRFGESTVFLTEDWSDETPYEPIALGGWLNKDVVGTKNWECRSYSGNQYAQFTSYNSGEINQAYLISPQINLTSATSPHFTFDVTVGYWNADALSILISEDFDGTESGINAATWHDVTSNFLFPQQQAGYSQMVNAGVADLSAWLGKNIYIAFRYSGDGRSEAERGTDPAITTTYQVDNIRVTDDLAVFGLITSTTFDDAGISNFIPYTYHVTAVYEGTQSSPSNSVSRFAHPPFGGGDGSLENPYHVYNADQLFTTRLYPHANYIQMSDIDLSTSQWYEGKGWEPIGTYQSPFVGGYNGQGYTLYNLAINRPDKDNIALFGVCIGANLQNINMGNAIVKGRHLVAGLAADFYGGGTISNVSINASVMATGENIGGVVGWLGDASISQSNSAGSVRASMDNSNYVGGLVGYMYSGTYIGQCYSSAIVEGFAGVGGLVGGTIEGSTISESFSYKSVSGNTNVGGLVGSSGSHVINCYSNAVVNGSQSVAGLIGLVQANSVVEYSYAVGTVTGNSYAGGLIGSNTEAELSVTSSYWNTERTGQSSSIGGEGLLTSQMILAGNFNAWDFTSIWTNIEGETYPFFRWYGTAMDHNYPETAIQLPVVSTIEVSDITQHTAISGGSVTDEGGSPVTAKGIVWNTSDSPTIEINAGITSNGGGLGSFVAELANLSPNTTYYVRAYATNSAGTAYGNQLQFTSIPYKDIPLAKLFSTSLSIGANDERWNMINPNYIDQGSASIDNLGSYWKMGWDPNSLYVKVVINDDNFCDEWCTGYVGSNWMADRIELHFNVSDNLNPPDDHGINPELENDYYLGYHQNTSHFQQGVTQLGRTLTNMYPHFTDYYHAYSIDGTTITYEFEIPWSSLVAVGIPYAPADGKEFGFDVKYVDWDYAEGNGEKNWWSPLSNGWMQINTIGKVQLTNQLVESETVPVVSTSEVVSITTISAYSGGTITYNGGLSVTNKGVVWSTTPSPSFENYVGITNEGAGDDPFTSSLTGLSPNTTYYLRAYASNSLGTGYGNEISFTTQSDQTYTIYFSNPGDWATPYIRLWGGDGSFTDQFPGEPMVAPAEGSIWYSFEVPSSYQNLLFSDGQGGDKTIDLYRSTTGWFDGVQWYDSEPYNTHGTLTDIDGNLYRTIMIGDQIWMAQNLKTKHYNNGDAIPTGLSNYDWQYATSGAVAIYPQDGVFQTTEDAMLKLYGAIYNWHAVRDSRNICPTGWRVASYEEWLTLINYLGGTDYAGGKLKSTGDIESGTGIWYYPNSGASNETNFLAVPGGHRNSLGDYYNLGYEANWWTYDENDASSGINVRINYNSPSTSLNALNKNDGHAVRCIYGSSATIPTVTTNSISSITAISAVSGGNVTSDGGVGVTARGVVWSTSEYPTIESAIGFTENGNGTGQFTSDLINLSPNTTYFVRAYATNSVGTAYGDQVWFTTQSPSIPVLTTKEVVLQSATTAISGGVISSDGGSSILQKGVVWSTSSNPTVTSYVGITNNGSGSADFNSNISGLAFNTRYYVRAYAQNSIGTAYGNEISFTTANSISFTVVSPSNSPILGALVNLAGEEKYTDANGTAIFYKVTGEYEYNISASGYLPAWGSVTVSDVDVAVNIKLVSESASPPTITGEQNVCSGSEVVYNITGSPSGWWEISGGSVVESTSSSVTVLWTTGYPNGMVSFQVNDDNYLTSYILPISVNTAHVMTVSERPQIHKKGHLNILICTTSDVDYKWFKDGLTLDNATGQYYVARQQAGDFKVQVKYSNQCPHTSASRSLSGKSGVQLSLVAYPNPSSGSFTLLIEGDSEGSGLLTIANTFGSIVHKEAVSKVGEVMTKEMTMNNLLPGVYLITLRMDEHTVATAKLTIQ